MRKITVLIPIAAFLIAFALGGHVEARESDDDVIFSNKNFVELGDLSVGISGTLTGDDLGYKNNTHSILCVKDRQECFIASIEQIGPHQIGRLEYVSIFPIVTWNDHEVVASEEPGDLGCAKTTITITRKSRTALWVQEPINQTRPQCAKSDTKIHKWTIEDSLGWKKLFGK